VAFPVLIQAHIPNLLWTGPIFWLMTKGGSLLLISLIPNTHLENI
jgi:hypothetical protein